MALFKPLVGGKERLQTTELHEGYAYFCDDGSLFFDYMDENGTLRRKQINAQEAETLLGATLSNKLTDSEFEIPTGSAVMQALNNYASVEYVDNQNVTTFELSKAYTDSQRLAYVEPATTILEETECVLNSDGHMVLPQRLNLEVGKTYTVKVMLGEESREYKVTGQFFGVSDVTGVMLLLLEPENDFGFMIIVYSPESAESYGFGTIIDPFGGNMRNIAIYHGTEIIHTIDPKFFPEGGVGYTKHQMNEIILPEQSLEFLSFSESGDGEPYGAFAEMSDLVSSGKYVVWFDRETYTCTAKSITNEGYTEISIGNLGYMGFYPDEEDNGLPFLIATGTTGEGGIIISKTGGVHTVSVADTVEIIHSIDPKYLPKGGVGYVKDKKYEVVIDPSKDYEILDGVVKISDLAPTMDEIVNGTMVCPNEDGDNGFVMVEIPITSDTLMPALEGYGYTINGAVWVVTKNGGELEVGIYVMETALDTPAPITIKWSTETIHTIDPKFIPDSIVRIDDIIQPVNPDWNQNDETALDYIKNKPEIATDDEIIDMLMQEDMFPVVTDSDGSMLADENGDILLW